MPKILFVCTANICRSPMAVGLFKAKLAQEGHSSDWQVNSGGTWGVDGRPAAREAIEVLAARGIDLRGHRSHILHAESVEAADLILTMERGHKEALEIEFPQKKGRIFLLTEMIGKHEDFTDPIGQPVEVFEEAAQNLERILDKGFAAILSHARGDEQKNW